MGHKTYTPIAPKFVFVKIKLKVLHYIQHGFIRQGPGLSKDHTNMFKSLVVNYLKVFLRIHSNGYIKGDKYFFFIKVGAANVLLKLNYL